MKEIAHASRLARLADAGLTLPGESKRAVAFAEGEDGKYSQQHSRDEPAGGCFYAPVSSALFPPRPSARRRPASYGGATSQFPQPCILAQAGFSGRRPISFGERLGVVKVIAAGRLVVQA